MLLLEPLLPSLVTTAVASTATVTSGKLAPAVNSGAILPKNPVAVTVLVSPLVVVNVKEKVYTSFVELWNLDSSHTEKKPSLNWFLEYLRNNQLLPMV